MDKKVVKEIILASAMYSLGSIFGPLLIIGGAGLLLDKLFNTSPWILLGSVLVAFIVTNVLLFKKIKKINRMMENYRQEALVDKHKDEETKA
jgi:F0F1-type ATP synthase assembly protein I